MFVIYIYIWIVQLRNGMPKHSDTETFHSNWKNKTPNRNGIDNLVIFRWYFFQHYKLTTEMPMDSKSLIKHFLMMCVRREIILRCKWLMKWCFLTDWIFYRHFLIFCWCVPVTCSNSGGDNFRSVFIFSENNLCRSIKFKTIWLEKAILHRPNNLSGSSLPSWRF